MNIFLLINQTEPGTPISGSLFTYLGGLFRRYHLEAVLVGGYAMKANNVQRTPFDIDFMNAAVN